MSLPRNSIGEVLTEYIAAADESVLETGAFPPLRFAWVIARHEGRVLMVYHRRRAEWEIPGGRMEKGESPRDCMVRELKEETGQTVRNLRLKGITKILPGVGVAERAGALYAGELEALEPFGGNEEIERICLWNGVSPLSPVSEIDAALVRMVKD